MRGLQKSLLIFWAEGKVMSPLMLRLELDDVSFIVGCSPQEVCIVFVFGLC